MAAGATTSTASHITKRIYLKGDLPSELVKRRRPFFGRMKRVSNYFGEDARYSWKYSDPQSISGPYSTAHTQSETAASSPLGYQLAMTPAEKFGRITVDGRSILRTKNNAAAFVRLWRHATEGMFEAFASRLGWAMFRDGTGLRGRRLSESSDVTTLYSGYYARDFEPQALVVAASDAAGSSLRDSGASTPVLSVGLAANTIGLDTSAISGYVDDDYLFYEGEVGSTYNCDGWEVHVPLTAPSSGESFRGSGNDRSIYPERMAGHRINNSTLTPEAKIGLLAVRIQNAGGHANCAYANPEVVWGMAQRLGAKVEFKDYGKTVKYGYQYIQIHTPAGILDVYADPDVPQNRAWVMNDNDCFLAHADAVMHVVQDDGRMTTRMPSDDGLEQRWRSLIQTYLLLPRDHGVCNI